MKNRNAMYHITLPRNASRETLSNPIAKLFKIREELEKTQKCVKQYIDNMWKMTNIYYNTNILKNQEFDYITSSSSTTNLKSKDSSQLNIQNPFYIFKFPGNQNNNNTSHCLPMPNMPVGLYESDENCHHSSVFLSDDLSQETMELPWKSTEAMNEDDTDISSVQSSNSLNSAHNLLRRSKEVYSFFKGATPEDKNIQTSDEEDKPQYLLKSNNNTVHDQQLFIKSDELGSLFADITQEEISKSLLKPNGNSDHKQKEFIRVDMVDSLFEDIIPEQILMSTPETVSDKIFNFSSSLRRSSSCGYNNHTTYPLEDELIGYKNQKPFKSYSNGQQRCEPAWNSSFLSGARGLSKRKQLLTNQCSFTSVYAQEYSDEEEPYFFRKRF